MSQPELTYTEAAEEVRRLIRGIKAVDLIVKALENIGSLENATREFQARLDDLTKRIAEGSEQLKVAQEAAKEQARLAEEMVAKAQAKAAQLLAEARDAVAERMEAMAEEEKALDEQLAEVKGAIVIATAQVEARKTELEELEQRIAAAKASIAKLLEA